MDANNQFRERVQAGMFEKILVPTDFSGYSEKTVEFAAKIPGVTEVVLVHIMEKDQTDNPAWMSGPQRETAQERIFRHLQKNRIYLEEHSIQVRDVVIDAGENDISSCILDSAKTEGVDLILIGARGKGIMHEILLGSVSENVLNLASCDVLITRYDGLFPDMERSEATPERSGQEIFEKILCPVDFSRPSEEVLRSIPAIDGVREVLLLHVIMEAGDRKELENIMQTSYRKLQDVCRILDNGKLSIKLMLRFGNPAQEICDFAVKENVSIIIISRHGARDYLRDIPIGSTVTEVVKKARMPVLVKYSTVEPLITSRELSPREFNRAEELWRHYRQQKADTKNERIFGLFLDDVLVSVARCTIRDDATEIDGVFTLEEFRKSGYAYRVIETLIKAFPETTLYLYSTPELVVFYAGFGFVPVDVNELPDSVRMRFGFALNELDGTVVKAMKRMPGSATPDM
jgi:nucleotide-binding universal stress UspA family protein/GNAT superfamily N-acetyltransferase